MRLIPCLVLTSCVLVGLSACSPADRNTPCEFDRECDDGWACLDGRCEDVDCRRDADCPGDQRCVEYVCKNAAGGCQGDDDCQIGTICDGGVCVEGCRTDRDCPEGRTCLADQGAHGVCAGCLSDADCPADQVCQDNECKSVCLSDEDCESGRCDTDLGLCVECLESGDCPLAHVCTDKICVPGCESDRDCPQDQDCVDGQCAAGCESNADCAPYGCLVCEEGRCIEPPAVCQGMQDCCEGFYCNFGTCMPTGDECQTAQDCPQPDGQLCDHGWCQDIQPECISDLDCPIPGEVCIDGACEQPGCTQADCAAGEWCNPQTGTCQPGCDSNDDCLPPTTCDFGSHTCQEQTDCCGGTCDPASQYCEALSCQCVGRCQQVEDCPAEMPCDLETGICRCSQASCPPGTHCDQASGQCQRDDCDPNGGCPQGFACDANTNTCRPAGAGGVGDPCFDGADCDADGGLLCDNSLLCILCLLTDPDFSPTYTCRPACSLMAPDCPAGTYCEIRNNAMQGMCMP